MFRSVSGAVKILDSLGNAIAGYDDSGTRRLEARAKLAAADEWAARVKVGDGSNFSGVVADGAGYLLGAAAKIAKGASSLVHLDAIDTAAGRGRLKATLYSEVGEPISFGTSAAPLPSNIKNDYVRTSGGSESMLVNGSVTNVVFTYAADATYDIALQELVFIAVANAIPFGAGDFGAVSGPLTNGLLVQVTANGNTGTVWNLRRNEDFLGFSSPGGHSWVVSSKDVLTSNWTIGGNLKLVHASSDNVKVTVRDNLSSAASYLVMIAKGNLLAAA